MFSSEARDVMGVIGVIALVLLLAGLLGQSCIAEDHARDQKILETCKGDPECVRAAHRRGL